MTDFFPSPNNPGIFSTFEWINAWQRAWGDSEKIIPVVPFINPETPRQSLYSYQQKKYSLFSFTTLFPAGISTVNSRSLRSEYFTLSGLAADQFINAAKGNVWDQFFIPDVLASSDEYFQLTSAAKNAGLMVNIRDTSNSYAVRLIGSSFDNYLKNIGSNTRLKLYNKRKRLYQLGSISSVNLWPQVDEFMIILNRFHVERWGKPCFEGRNLQQITHFLQGISLAGGAPDLSVIYCDGKPVSVVLDLYYRQRIYNIQSGYIEKFKDGISLGTLHLGMQIEKAFSSDAYFYDFMAGTGKNSNYKKSLATDVGNFVSLMLVRSPLLKCLYRIKDTMKH